MARSTMVVLALLAMLAASSYAMIQEFTTSNKNNLLPVDSTGTWWTAMYSLADSPAGSVQPYVSVDIRAVREEALAVNASAVNHAAALIYEAGYGKYVGYVVVEPTKHMVYCCTADLKAKGLCDDLQVGELLIRSDPNVHVVPISFAKGETSAVLTKSVNVLRTGIYYLQLTNCGGDALGQLTLSGEAVWMNPYGYLPGDVYALLPLMGVLSLGYLAISLYYGFLMFRHRAILLKIQWGVFGVIIAGIIEVSSWYFYRLGINNNGHYSILGLVIVVFINAVKKMVSRVLVLLVAMGVGTVKWSIGQAKVKLALLSMFYLFFAFLFQLVKEIEAVAKTEAVSSFVSLLIIVPSAILDAFFYYWIILSLIRTIQQLTLRHQTLKLEMYKAFFIVIGVAAALSILMVLYQSYLHAFTTGVSWQNEWIFDGFWELLYYGLMVATAILWRPRANNTRYSYAEFFEGDEGAETAQDDDNTQVQLETLTVLGGGGEVSKKNRQGGDASETKSTGPKAAQADPSERVRQATNKMTAFEKDIMSFDLPSDDEDEGGISVETQLKKMD